MPDKLYIDWQMQIFKLFKKNIIFKIHPKEQLSKFYNNEIKTFKGDIVKYFNNYNVLIFDHVSTF